MLPNIKTLGLAVSEEMFETIVGDGERTTDIR